MDFLENKFEELKPKFEKYYSNFFYLRGFIEKKCNLFSIESDEIEGDLKKILEYKYLNGHVGFCRIDNKIYFGWGAFKGTKNKNGLYDEYIISFPDGTTYSGKIGTDIVVLYNNNQYMSDLYQMNWYSQMLTETDISLKKNVIYSRQIKIPIAKSDVEKKSIENAITEGENGNSKIIMNDVATNLLMSNDNGNDIPTLDLFNPSIAVYLQNLSRFHDELIIRAGLECGICITARDKGAQLNENELNAFRSYATITIDDEFDYLKKWVKEMKDVFGVNIVVDAKSFVQTEEEIEEIEHPEEIEEIENENQDEEMDGDDNDNIE